MRLSTTTFIDGICTWMKKKRKGAFHSKRRSSSVSSITVKSLTSLNDYEATESREYETYDLNQADTDDALELDDSLSTLVLSSSTSTSTFHKCKVQEALEYERSLRVQSTLQLHQYW